MSRSKSVRRPPIERHTRSFRLLALSVGLLIGLAMAEILVRLLFRYNTPDTVRTNSLQYQPTIFARHLLLPNQSPQLYRAWGDDAATFSGPREYRIGDSGYRGNSFPIPKPPNTQRIVVFGGSAVFDPNSDEGSDWPSLTEKILKRSGWGNLEIINAGVPGHATFDSLGRLYSQVWLYEPDYVLLYNAWNDIKYINRVSTSSPLSSVFSPYDPESDPFRSYRGFLDRFLCRLQLYVKLRNRYLLWKYRPGPEGSRLIASHSQQDRAFGMRQYRLNIELFVDAARNIGAVPLLLTQATLVSRDNDESARARIEYGYQGMTAEDHGKLVKAFKECNDIVRHVALSKGVSLLDLDQKLSGRPELFADHIHLTETGSKEISRVLAGFLAEKLHAPREKLP